MAFFPAIRRNQIDKHGFATDLQVIRKVPSELPPVSSPVKLSPAPSVVSRANVLGVGVSAIDMKMAVRLAQAAIEHGRKGYICVTGVHGVMEAQSDPGFKCIQNASLLTVPDGMPTVWLGRIQGHKHMARVYGPDLMLAICELSERTGYTHFLYGGKPGVAGKLACALKSRFPNLQLVGTYTPPFHALSENEEEELRQLVARVKPDFFWVGLSTPKQERFMVQYVTKLPVKLMVGVGAAFDIHTGAVQDAPVWVKKMGLQWLHRLNQEPSRLCRRYLVNNPKFLYYVALQLLGLREYAMVGVVE
jgi:N-acetylglucosaminyldiphosphoundecaprenol N-acetyl-beta-D-mannosaminyltransferase